METDGGIHSHSRFEHSFRTIIEESRRAQPWHLRLNLKQYVTLKNVFAVAGILSILFIEGMAFLRIVPEDTCNIPDPSGRCCDCPKLTEAQLAGQKVHMSKVPNTTFFALTLLVNGAFGVWFTVAAVWKENKFLLFCVAPMQACELARAAVELLNSEGRVKTLRIVCFSLAWVTMLASWALMRPVYKSFGWRIFRRGGTKRSILNLYKTYQRYRAFNLVDMQGAGVFYLACVLMLEGARTDYGWILVAVAVVDGVSSRLLVRHLKREDLKGVLLAASAKVLVVAWWLAMVINYIQCYQSFSDLRKELAVWWNGALVPSLESASNAFLARSTCMAHPVEHDRATFELVVLSFSLALAFRIGLLIFVVIVARNFHKGLTVLFYQRPQTGTEAFREQLMQDTANETAAAEEYFKEEFNSATAT